MESVFPEARSVLKDADPEMYALVQDEKVRQWYVSTRKIAHATVEHHWMVPEALVSRVDYRLPGSMHCTTQKGGSAWHFRSCFQNRQVCATMQTAMVLLYIAPP